RRAGTVVADVWCWGPKSGGFRACQAGSPLLDRGASRAPLFPLFLHRQVHDDLFRYRVSPREKRDGTPKATACRGQQGKKRRPVAGELLAFVDEPGDGRGGMRGGPGEKARRVVCWGVVRHAACQGPVAFGALVVSAGGH